MSFALGIIGAGNMAEAIARGVLSCGQFKSDQIIAADSSPERRALFQSDLKIATTEDNLRVAREARVLLLSVKPQHMTSVLGTIAPVLGPQTLIVSIAAGITTGFIERHLGEGKRWRVIRAMPNTPMLVGEGISAIARGAHSTPDDLVTARRLFEAAGTVIDVTEDKMNAVTALSGSGPAYFFYLVEQMIRAATEMGMTADEARVLASKTALGAAKMLGASKEPPEELRRRVTSPGGTTQAAIELMESRKVAEAVIDAIKAAEARGRELGQ